jgi:predicted flap endonuclease-1-like 5' DNA nuclease
MGMLCRVCGCAVRARGGQESPAKKPTREKAGENPSDDFTVIRGIGMVIQDRLYRSGIKSFAELARTSPEELRSALGTLAQGGKAEEWISEARMLAQKG